MSDLDDLLDQILGRPGDHVGASVEDAAWAALTETGLTRVGIAETLGGSGGDLADAATVTSKIAEAGLITPCAETLFPIAHIAAVTGRPVPPGVVALVSPAPGTCTVEGDGYRVEVSGAHAAWAAQADELWLVATLDGDTAVLARLRPGQWTATPARNLAGEPRDRVDIATVLPRDAVDLLPATMAAELRLLGALGRSCQSLGALRACLRLSHEYVLVREQFGTPLAAHQVVRHAVARMAEEVAAAETAVGHAVSRMPAAGRSPDTAATIAVGAAKIQTATSATRVARAAHQLHGAIGLTAEHPLHHFTTPLWSWRDEYGSADDWSAELATLVRTAYTGDLWAVLTGQN